MRSRVVRGCSGGRSGRMLPGSWCRREHAVAHESTLEALTVDLLLDQSGLVVVDAATNHASYDQAPSPAERAVVAGRVGDALGIPRSTSSSSTHESSTLYHEVGFRMSLHAPFSNTLPAGAVQIDTAPLQEIAADFGSLVLDVCGVAKPGITVAVTVRRHRQARPAPAVSERRRSTAATATCGTWASTIRRWRSPRRRRCPVPAEPVAQDRVTLPCGSPSSGAGDPTFVSRAVSDQSGRVPGPRQRVRAAHLLVPTRCSGSAWARGSRSSCRRRPSVT